MDAYAFPPLSVRVVEVVLVDCQRGDGDLRRDVLQVFSKTGDLLAEHDRIHCDPVYAAYFLRERVTPEMLCIWSGEGNLQAAGHEAASSDVVDETRRAALQLQARSLELKAAAMTAKEVAHG